jgi:hypothetical protein
MDPLLKPTSRRTFAKGIATVAALPLLAPLASCAPAGIAAPTPGAPASAPAPSGTPAGAASSASPEAEALTNLLRARYGDRLTAEQWEEVREGVVGNVRAAEQLRRFALPIDVEPAIRFTPFRVTAP